MFDHYYCIKNERPDSLRFLIFIEGIPHYSYIRIYADKNGNVTKILRERDGGEFYQMVTDFRDNKYYFGEQLVNHIDTLKCKIDTVKRPLVAYEQMIGERFNGRFCSELKFPPVIGEVRVARPRLVIPHLGHKRLLKNKYKKLHKYYNYSN